MARMMSPQLRSHYDLALQQALEAERRGDFDQAWCLLERAHVIGQAWIGPHLRSHWAMLRMGWLLGDGREITGQIFRLAFVIPGTWLGRLPLGNTGGANVNPFQPMPLPDDLKELLTPHQLT